MCLGKLGSNGNRLIHASQSFFIGFQTFVQAPQIELRLRIVGLQLQDRSVAIHRVSNPAQPFQNRSPVVVGDCQRGGQCDGFLKRRQCFRSSPQAQQGIAPVEIRIHIIALQCNGPVIGLDGIRHPVGLQPPIALGVARLGIIGQGRQRLPGSRLRHWHTKRHPCGRKLNPRALCISHCRAILETNAEIGFFSVGHTTASKK